MTVSSNAHHEPRAAVSREMATCPVCRHQFRPYRPWSRFCGSTCKREHERQVRRIGEAQLGLRLDTPIARTSDPSTSHLAAQAVTESGARASHCAAVYAVLVLASKPLTYREVASKLPHFEAVEVMRRLCDLREERRVDQGDKRACRVSGRQAVTWFARVQEQAA